MLPTPQEVIKLYEERKKHTLIWWLAIMLPCIILSIFTYLIGATSWELINGQRIYFTQNWAYPTCIFFALATVTALIIFLITDSEYRHNIWKLKNKIELQEENNKNIKE